VIEMAPPPPKGTREIAVDGSNVLFGGGTSATPRVKNLELVIKELKKAGWKPVVWVDASRKYDVDDPAKLRAMIATGVVRDIPAGTPADYWVLDHASKHGCKVLSNDRFAVWAEKFPIVKEPERFVRFMVNGGEASFWGEADRVDRRLPAAREGPKLERWIKPGPARRSRPLKIPSPRTKPEIRPTAPVPVISSIRHTIFFATALAAFWVLFAVGFYVVLNDPYRIFAMLIGFLGRPLAIAVFAFAGLITAEYAANHAVRGLGPGNPRAIVLLATFLTMFLIPAALGALTWYVFPFGTGLFRWVMPAYCAAMAVGAFAVVWAWWCSSSRS
jgi:hypothetical protein